MATEIERYIRQAAAKRGIDPNIAVRTAKGEGGVNDPTRRAEYVKGGYREPSYGPFQLLIGGQGTGFPTGMGNDALAAGIDPRDPNQWQRGVDFALDQAKQGGWGPWFGAKAAGITGMMGIGGTPAPQLSPAAADFVKNNPQPGGFGLPVEQAAGLAPAPPAPPGGGFFGTPQTPIPPAVASYANEDDKKKSLLGRLGDALSEVPDAPAPRLMPMGDARQTGGLLGKALGEPKIAEYLLKRRMA